MWKINYLDFGRQLHDDLAQLLALGQPLKCISRLLHRIHAIDNWPQLALAQSAHDLRVLRRIPHRRTQEAPVMPEQSPQIEMHLRPRCRATGHQSAPAPETAERAAPRRGS